MKAMTSTRRRQEQGPGVGHGGPKEHAKPGHESTGTSRRSSQVMMSIRKRQGWATMALRRRLGRATTSTRDGP